LAHRIHLALMHELGQGIDVARLLDDDRYARDVLLVCQAYPATELAPLGAAFARLPRPALAVAAVPDAEGPARGRRSPRRRDASAPACAGFADTGGGPPSGLRRWLVPSNWFVR
jgi:hypothetical protein